jgi:hypothetical protein
MIYANAYIILDTERSYHDYIPWSACVKYGAYYSFTRDQIDWLIEIVRAVDNSILEERAKRSGNPNRSSTAA